MLFEVQYVPGWFQGPRLFLVLARRMCIKAERCHVESGMFEEVAFGGLPQVSLFAICIDYIIALPFGACATRVSSPYCLPKGGGQQGVMICFVLVNPGLTTPGQGTQKHKRRIQPVVHMQSIWVGRLPVNPANIDRLVWWSMTWRR